MIFMSYVSAMLSLDGHSESGKVDVANMIVNKLTDSDRIHVISVPELLIRIDKSPILQKMSISNKKYIAVAH